MTGYSKKILEHLNAYQHNLYLQARRGRFARGKYHFDNGDEVNGIIPDTEAWIESAAAKATDSVPEDLANAFKRLDELRVARKMKASEDQKEQDMREA